MKLPYDVDCTWSSEAESLREIAVKTPDKLSEAFILKFFKSLRIVDKKVRSYAGQGGLVTCFIKIVRLG